MYFPPQKRHSAVNEWNFGCIYCALFVTLRVTISFGLLSFLFPSHYFNHIKQTHWKVKWARACPHAERVGARLWISKSIRSIWHELNILQDKWPTTRSRALSLSQPMNGNGMNERFYVRTTTNNHQVSILNISNVRLPWTSSRIQFYI